ncbi:MAG: hypothetical protein ACRD3G_09555 [Vicinamibacterales bacterium]
MSQPAAGPPGQRFFFCHLQKTGGTSLLLRLRRFFGARHVYPTRADGDRFARVFSVPLLQQRWQERGSQIRLVTGHFPLCTQDLLGGGFRTFTILREPVTRTLSYLRHCQVLIPADRGKSLEALYAEQPRFEALVHNHMVKMLSLTPEEMTRGMLTRVAFDEARLAAAKRRLQSIDVLGVQERFDEFCASLESTFGFDLGPPVFVNHTLGAPASPAFCQRISEDNALDVELYRFALTLLETASPRPFVCSGPPPAEPSEA